MQLQSIKVTLASAWVLLVTVVGLLLGVASSTGVIALATLGLLPAVGVFVLWHDPTPSLSESITKALR